MWWPGNLSTIALFVSFHDVKTETTQPDRFKLSRYAFFWIAFAGMFLYTFIPEFLLPGLQVVSLLCLFGSRGDKPNGLTDKNLFASGTSGQGILALTFDWQYILGGTMTSPFWATLNVTIGAIFFGWIVVPLLFFADPFGGNRDLTLDGGATVALNTPRLFNGNMSSPKYGTAVKPVSFFDKNDFSLNQEAFDLIKPIRVTPAFFMTYGIQFLRISAVVSHVILWYGKDIKRQFMNAIKQVKDEVDALDIHTKMMEAYPEVPDWAYLGWLGLNTFIMIACCLWTPFRMPIWAVFVNLAMSLFFIMPCGLITAVSGVGIYINVIAQMIIGLLIPGDTIGVMAFKSMGTNNLIQALTLVSDLKLGHYLHIPPLAMVAAQMWGTLLSVIAGLGATWFMLFNTNGLLDTKQGDWTMAGYQTFYSAGAIWGAIGPVRFWGVLSIYTPILYCFLIGFLAPFLPWALNKWVYKSKHWHLINFPLFFVPVSPGYLQNSVVVPLLVAFVFQVVVFKRFRAWYEKYNYVMASAFDGSTALAIIII
ncbi:hypothetical protein HDV05_001067, partial [Chytridiales sp. JEL 0842]